MATYDESNSINTEILQNDGNNDDVNESLTLRSIDDVPDSLIANNTLNLACTNARSVVNKIGSLVTLFEEMRLHFALLTETWLTSKVCSKRAMDDLTNGANISFIRRDRGTRGGGVAICYKSQVI